MPKLVTQLAQGNSFSLSAESGSGAYSATRSWKVILNAPNETYDINAVTGVNIGTPYSQTNPIPCVSIEARADGESRLVRIITAPYRTTPGIDPTNDPKTQQPTVRPALYSMSTSLTEIAAWGGRVVTGGASGPWVPATNPVGDLVDGVVRLEPVVNIQVEQYSTSDMSSYMGYTGYVNSQPFTFSGLTIGTHCCMLQGLASTPIVEQFGEVTFRGFKVTFTFAVRSHYTYTRDGAQAIGWDVAIPQTGFNIVNSGANQGGVDTLALNLEHRSDTNTLVTPYRVATGSDGEKMRAAVTIAATSGGGLTQRPAAQPVALNDNGTPRARTANPPVLINRICLQPEMAFGNNFSNFGIRWIS